MYMFVLVSTEVTMKKRTWTAEGRPGGRGCNDGMTCQCPHRNSQGSSRPGGTGPAVGWGWEISRKAMPGSSPRAAPTNLNPSLAVQVPSTHPLTLTLKWPQFP